MTETEQAQADVEEAPCVIGRFLRSAAKSKLIVDGRLDVQPADSSVWIQQDR